jgi:hypothetical protein
MSATTGNSGPPRHPGGTYPHGVAPVASPRARCCTLCPLEHRSEARLRSLHPWLRLGRGAALYTLSSSIAQRDNARTLTCHQVIRARSFRSSGRAPSAVTRFARSSRFAPPPRARGPCVMGGGGGGGGARPCRLSPPVSPSPCRTIPARFHQRECLIRRVTELEPDLTGYISVTIPFRTSRPFGPLGPLP